MEIAAAYHHGRCVHRLDAQRVSGEAFVKLAPRFSCRSPERRTADVNRITCHPTPPMQIQQWQSSFGFLFWHLVLLLLFLMSRKFRFPLFGFIDLAPFVIKSDQSLERFFGAKPTHRWNPSFS